MQAIYAHHVLTGLGTFEEIPPDLAEMTARFRRITGAGWPYLVAADAGGAILGYAYASEFRLRSGYRHTCENSVYIAPAAQRRGVGLALMREIIRLVVARDQREMLALIGDSDNHASIGLHRALGFEHVGTFRNVGLKFGRWVDVVMMQRSLGSGQAQGGK